MSLAKRKKNVFRPARPKGSGMPAKPAKGSIGNNTSRDHIYRIFVIFSELQNRQRKPTAQSLAALLGVDKRTILRDIDAMNLLLEQFETTATGPNGVEDNSIVYDKGERRYKLMRELRHFPMIRVENEDLLMLHFLRQCLSPYEATGIGRSMIDSFNRTFGILVGSTDFKRWERAVHFRFEGRPEIAKEDVRLFNLLHQAILENRVVSLDYKPARDPKSHRIVEPHFLFMRNGSWYLHASKSGIAQKRTLKFARISNVRLTGDTFKPYWVDPADCFKYSFGVVPSQSKARAPVVIEFNKDSAQRVEETLWHAEQKVTKLPGGGVRLELPFDVPTYLELKPWILSWGRSAKVIGPSLLKDQVEEDIRAMAEGMGL